VDPGYDDYHAPRYAFLIRLLREFGVQEGVTVLDVGRSSLTARLRDEFRMPIDSIGFGEDGTSDGGRHFEFDLNLAQDRERWRAELPAYEVVVMAEVLEHLHTAPELVLAFIGSLLAPNGLLIVQTPNAAALTKRIKLLLGRNPYEMLRADQSDPGHYREYTIAELRKIGQGLGLHEERCVTGFYFDARFARHGREGVHPQPLLGTIKNAMYALLPAKLREGITVIWRKTSVEGTRRAVD
jgi:SAM-dependent methyltransferase